VYVLLQRVSLATRSPPATKPLDQSDPAGAGPQGSRWVVNGAIWLVLLLLPGSLLLLPALLWWKARRAP
jgi:hypothetical protein